MLHFTVTAMWILSYDWSFELYSGYFFRPWRLLMLIYALPGIIATLWLLRFHESPKFLLMKSQENKAVDVLKWINKVNKGNVNSDDLEIAQLSTISSTGTKAVVNNKNT